MFGKLAPIFVALCCLATPLIAQEQVSNLPDSIAYCSVLSQKTGTASFYALKFNGRRTSNGEKLDNAKYTCAHPKLPFDTYVRVTNLKNGKAVVVRVTDRFRQKGDHLIDLTRVAAKDIDMIRQGRARVLVEVLDSVQFVVRP